MIKKLVFILVLHVSILYGHNLGAQVITLSAASLTTTSGLYVKMDTIHVNNTATLTNDATLEIKSVFNAGALQGNGTYNIHNDFLNTGNFTANSSTVHFSGNNNQYIPALVFNNLTASGTGSIKSATGNLVVNGTLNVNGFDTLDLLAYTLSGSLPFISGTGVIKTQNISQNPIPGGKTWPGEVCYNSSSSQYIVGGDYNHLNTAGGNRVLATALINIAGVFTTGPGNFSNDGSTIGFNGALSQNIPAFSFNNLVVAGGGIKTAAGNLSVKDCLSMGENSKLALGAFDITLKSTSTTVARIANTPSSANISYGTGRFIVERYVPGRRKYRLFTSPVTSSDNTTLLSGEEALSIWSNWQNAGTNVNANTGTIITGGSAADGFDQQTTTASMFTYDDINKKYVAYNTANGKNTKYSPLKAGVAYYLFIYGDRTNTITTSNPKFTTISSRGKILTGDQTYTTTSSNPLSGVTGRFSMLGNPFASPIDWSSVSKTNISNTFWGWDPNLSSTGGYVTVSTTGLATLISPFSGSVGLNQYIQPGQGFFVKTTGASPEMTIRESDKVSNFNNVAFRNGSESNNLVNNIPLIAINLQYPSGANTLLADGALAAFDNSFLNSVGNEDATKVAGTAEAVSLQRGADLLSIEARKLPNNSDTIFINLAKITRPQYTLQIFAHQMTGSTVSPFLEDAYLNTSQVLSLADTNRITFNVVSGVPASSAADRFKIVFRDLAILDLSFTSLKAYQKNKDIQVEWFVEEDGNTQKYEIEHSINATNFTKVGELPAHNLTGIQAYEWLHVQPQKGKNFYRIKGVSADGKKVASSIVYVNNNSDVLSAISIFPNPVKNHQLNIRFSDVLKGEYKLQIINVQGKMVFTQKIHHNGGNFNHIVNFSNTLTSASYYYLKISGNDKKYSQKIFLE